MECQAGERLSISSIDNGEAGRLATGHLQEQTVSFMDYTRSFSRDAQISASNDVCATSAAPGCMITTNPLCYLSGQFMDVKGFGSRAGSVFPGTVYPATNFYRGPFPEMPFTPLGRFQSPAINLRQSSMAVHPEEPSVAHNFPGLNYPHDEAEKAFVASMNGSQVSKGTAASRTIRRRSRSRSPEAAPARSPNCSPPSPSPPPSPRDETDSLPAAKKYPDYCRTLVVKDANGATKELVFPKALDLDRPKRARTTFSAEQLFHLEREFNRNQYLVGRERTDLAIQLQLSETQVKVWFQNRRTKHKRDQQREAEERHANAESLAACNILRILQPKHPAGGTANTSTQMKPSKDEPAHFSHNPFLPPNLTGLPLSASSMLSLPRPPFYSH